jgi:hypothetical protein
MLRHLRSLLPATAVCVLVVLSSASSAETSRGPLSLVPDPTDVALRTEAFPQSWEPPPPPPTPRCFSPDYDQYWQVDDNQASSTVPVTFACNGYLVAPFTYHGVDRFVTREPSNPNPSSEVIQLVGLLPARLCASRIHLITYASWALDMPTGTEVGRVILHFVTGLPQALPLQVGMNTAEWSYDRPEAQGCLQQHAKIPARVAFSWETSQDSDSSYMAHNYYSYLDLDGRELASVELQVSTSAYLQEVNGGSPCWTPEKYNVGITAITVQGEVGTAAHSSSWGRIKVLYR